MHTYWDSIEQYRDFKNLDLLAALQEISKGDHDGFVFICPAADIINEMKAVSGLIYLSI